MPQNGLSKLKRSWNETNPEERRKRIAWSVATSCAIETGGDPVVGYEKLMSRFERIIEEQGESDETC